MHVAPISDEVQRLQLEVERLQKHQKLMDDWIHFQQETINMGETLPPISFQVMPPAHQHTHSQVAQSAMRNLPMQSHESQRNAQNMMNVNPSSYKVRGETSTALQRSEVEESHQHVQNEVRRPHIRLLPTYSQRPRIKATTEYHMLVAKSLSKSTQRQTSRQKSVRKRVEMIRKIFEMRLSEKWINDVLPDTSLKLL